MPYLDSLSALCQFKKWPQPGVSLQTRSAAGLQHVVIVIHQRLGKLCGSEWMG